ncbi:hypothetical protein SAMD00020551_2174 [Mesobacillus selenatarsenatis SF-1]|uniref:Uncharacterized protein n=1 Tax=Mesobacillus selenatarsenatis (strain DSM 18680 / JCM 14380 / FERM P-15431 / SF-1) TaxID=1321606 RepID=A0A0A8X4Q9_MESS1|nr:hypothetical protein SAMD00020551_2174 [Mesobacillus selenatarsenatis SF-1]
MTALKGICPNVMLLLTALKEIRVKLSETDAISDSFEGSQQKVV